MFEFCQHQLLEHDLYHSLVESCRLFKSSAHSGMTCRSRIHLRLRTDTAAWPTRLVAYYRKKASGSLWQVLRSRTVLISRASRSLRVVPPFLLRLWKIALAERSLPLWICQCRILPLKMTSRKSSARNRSAKGEM